MKPVIIFAVTLVVGLAGGTGAKVMTTKAGSAVKADSTHADSTGAKHDSTAKAGEHGDTAVVASGEAVHAPADTMPRAAVPMQAGAPAAAAHGAKDSTVHAPDAKSVIAAAKAVGAPPAPKVSAAGRAITDSIVDASERRIAKVFTAMDAKQAAKVLEHMTDSDVQVILGYVGPKQAAAIMVAMPPERAAKLGKAAMLGSPAR
jgi:hypothetical protein